MNLQEIQQAYEAMNYTLTIAQHPTNGKPTARCTRPSKGKFGYKTLFNYYYHSEDRMIQSLKEFITKEQEYKQRKEAEKQTKKENTNKLNASEHFKQGDIIVNSWGWEQTNIDFYKVIEVLPKSLKVQQVKSQMVENSLMSHGMACDVIPSDVICGEPFLLRLKADAKNNVWICNPESYYYFHKWDGRPLYRSWYA